MPMPKLPPMALGRRCRSTGSAIVGDTHDLSSLESSEFSLKNNAGASKRLAESLDRNGETPAPSRDVRDDEESSAYSGEKERVRAEKGTAKAAVPLAPEDEGRGAVKSAATNSSKKAKKKPMSNGDDGNAFHMNPIREDRIEDNFRDDMIGRTISVESNADQNKPSNNGQNDSDTLTFASQQSTHHLLEQQSFLQNASEEIRKEYYGALSQVAILNAKAESRKAELELKKIELEKNRLGMEKLCVDAQGRCIEASAGCGGGLDLVRDAMDDIAEYVNELFENPEDETSTLGESTLVTNDRTDGGSTLVTAERTDGESTLGTYDRSHDFRRRGGTNRHARGKTNKKVKLPSLAAPSILKKKHQPHKGSRKMDADVAKLEQVKANMERALKDAARMEASIAVRQNELQRALEELRTLRQTVRVMKVDVVEAELEQSKVEKNLTRGGEEAKKLREELRRVVEEAKASCEAVAAKENKEGGWDLLNLFSKKGASKK